MRILLTYLILLSPALISCKGKSASSESIKKDGASNSVTASPPFECDYENQKKRCQELFSTHKKDSSRENKLRLINFISDSLLPCWYGTPWDFNGTTQIPQQGNIACGYFVTTTLRDAGLTIDRKKLAQCASEQLVKTTCTEIRRYSNKSLNHFVEEIRKSGFGLYIVGLDNHTGFILNDGKEVYFIHSGVITPRCALKEKAIESKTLRFSNYRVVGKIIL